MTCGGFSAAATAGALTAWAQCWFALLMMLVVLTMAFIFIIWMFTVVSFIW
jgi:hypothetical protein